METLVGALTKITNAWTIISEMNLLPKLVFINLPKLCW